jgi:hypothetical protein
MFHKYFYFCNIKNLFIISFGSMRKRMKLTTIKDEGECVCTIFSVSAFFYIITEIC